MQGLMTNPVRNIKPKEGLSMGQEIAMISEKVADYLVNELKKEE